MSKDEYAKEENPEEEYPEEENAKEEYPEEENAKEEYPEDEYIENHNDPFSIEKITEEDYDEIPSEEIIELDEVYATISNKISNLQKYDKLKEAEILKFLKNGGFRN